MGENANFTAQTDNELGKVLFPKSSAESFSALDCGVMWHEVNIFSFDKDVMLI